MLHLSLNQLNDLSRVFQSKQNRLKSISNIPAKRSANVRACGAFGSSNICLAFLEDGLLLNILSIENDDVKSIV